MRLCAALLLTGCGGGGGGAPNPPGPGSDRLQIAEHPVDTTAVEGNAARFAVRALNARSYQWQRLIAGAWQDLAAQQADAMLLPSVGLGDAGAQFRVQVRGDTESLTSTAATLTVTRKPLAAAISVQPASLVLADGDGMSWSVTATGTELNYQWQRSRDGLNWTDVSGATAAQWSPGKAVLADNGLRVRVVVGNALGSVTSGVASLEVYPAPAMPTFSMQPVDARVQSGQTASFEAQVLGQPAPALQWQRSSNGTQWEDVPQAQSARLQVAAVSAKDDGSQFRLSASNRAGQVFSQVVRLTVQPAAQALSWQSEPQSLQVGIGQDAVFTAQVTAGAPATLQWQFSRDAGMTWQTLTGANDARLVIASASSREAGNWYRAQASNAAGQITSRAAQLQLDARLQMRLLLGDGRGRGHRDGALLDAKMDEIAALAQDAQGHLYLTDSASHVLRKIDFATGRVSTLAGAPYQRGRVDGNGSAARFDRPRAVAVDAKGQVFVIDVRNQRIRAISPTGAVSTVIAEPDPVKHEALTDDSALAVHPQTGELFYSVGCAIYRVSGAGSAELWTGASACGLQQDGDRRDAIWWRVLDFGIDATGTLIANDGSKIRRVLPGGQVETLGDWKDMRTALQFKRPKRARDGALYAGATMPNQAFVHAYPATADGSTPLLDWDAVAGKFPGAELVAGALGMAALPPQSNVLNDGSIFNVTTLAGGSAWVSTATSATLWQLDRDGHKSAWLLPAVGAYLNAIVMLPDQLLACRAAQGGSYGNELVSIQRDGSARLLASWPNKDASADMGSGYCKGLLWDAARSRVFEVASGSTAVYDVKAQKLSQANELGYAIGASGQSAGLLAVYPDGALLVRDADSSLLRLGADGSTQRLVDKPSLFAMAGVVDQSGTAFLLSHPIQGTQVYRLKAGGSLERLAGTPDFNSTEPGHSPSWREAFGLRIWGPDQLLVVTRNELTVLDVPSGVDCGCTPPAQAALARKAQMLKRH